MPPEHNDLKGKLEAAHVIGSQQSNLIALGQKGLALLGLGRFTEARVVFEGALRIQPNHFDVLQILGVILVKLGEYPQAVECLSKALQINPNYADAYSNCGVALKELKRFDEALASYDKAIALNPDYADAYNNRGVVLQELKRFNEALASYDKAIALNPDYADAYNNRGVVLQELKRFNEALASYDKAIALNPNYADAYSNRGIALTGLKHFDEALASYDKAIALNPNYADAYSNRGIALAGLKHFDEALASYDKAIALNPNYADAYYNRGNTLKDLVQLTDARASYIKALELESDHCLARWELAFISIPPLFTARENLNISREIFATEIRQLDEWFSGTRLDEAYKVVGSTQPFYLAYQELNNKELLSQYGRVCHRLMAHWQHSKNIQPNIISGSGPIKIGIISSQIHKHSVWVAVTKGWVLKLDPTKFEIHIFHLGSAEDEETYLAQTLATSFTKKQGSLFETVNSILEKRIEVLLYPEIGMDMFTTQLANLRLAPIQLTAWGHPETSGLPTMDHYLSSDLFETDTSEAAYTENLIKLPNLGCSYMRLPIITSEPDMQKLGLDTKTPILLCPGAPFKYGPNYDLVLIEIVKKLRCCKLVFFSHHKNLTIKLKQRLEKSFSDVGLNFNDYLVFLPLLNIDEFYGLMKRADVFLDTIGFSGFNTAIQAIDCALPIVTREGKFMRGRLASGILKRIGMQELIAETEKEYIDIAVRLVQDKKYRNQVSQKIIKTRDILYDDMEPIKFLEDFLMSKCRT